VSDNDGEGLVRRYFAAAEAGDLEVFDALFAPGYVNHRVDGTEDRGPDGMRAFIRGVLARIRGLSVEVHDLFADGDKVAAKITLRGTWTATGTPIAVTEIQLYRVAGGKIVDRWWAVDRSGLPQ
jgi:ketosteroid isomerase-like protein